MRGLAWVLVVGLLWAYVVAATAQSELDPTQRIVVAYPAFLLWGVWSVGYLSGIKRRAATLVALARISYRLRALVVMSRRRRRLAAARRRSAPAL